MVLLVLGKLSSRGLLDRTVIARESVKANCENDDQMTP